MERVVKTISRTPLKVKVIGIASVLAMLLYALGIKVAFVPVLLALNMAFLPMPKIFSSWLARFVVSALIAASLLQLAATIQFFVLPQSSFVALAALTLLLHIGLWLWAPRVQHDKKLPIANTNDAAGLVAAIFFLLPLAVLFVGNSFTEGVARMGSVQVIDAVIHQQITTHVTEAEHFPYEPGAYYPMGFHITAGFVADSFVGEWKGLGWTANITLYFLQYVFLGIVTMYMVYLVCVRLLALFGGGSRTEGIWVKLLVALCLAPMVALLYVVPSVQLGFFNYFYVITAMLCAILFLLELHERKRLDPQSILNDDYSRWFIVGYLLLAFSVVCSWVLFLPVVMVSVLLYLAPSTLHLPTMFRTLFARRAAIVWAGFLALLVPLYIQIVYSAKGAGESLNLTGALQEFFGLIVLAGLALVIWLQCAKNVPGQLKQSIWFIYMPLFVLVLGLVAMQLAVVGDIRYYAIKVSWLLEILLITLGVAYLVYVFVNERKWPLAKTIFLPVISVGAVVLLVGSIASNPFVHTRDMLRDFTYPGKPARLANDIRIYVSLAEQGKIQQYNAMALHYDTEKQVFYNHPKLAYWGGHMQYDGDPQEHKSMICAHQLFELFINKVHLQLGEFEGSVRDCVSLAQKAGLTYYIITDEASAPVVRQAFGQIAHIVY